MATERFEILITQRGAKQVEGDINRIASAADRAGTSGNTLANSLKALGGALVVRAIYQTADSMQNLHNRLILTAGSTEKAAAQFDQLFDVAQRTRTSVEGTITVFARMRLTLDENKVSTEELIGITESMQMAVTLSGASAQEATNAMIQLSQGMSQGSLQGEELKSVLEQLPYVADIIAKGMDTTRASLKQLGKQNKITADEIINAFREAKVEIQEAFLKTIVTLGQGMQVLKNGFMGLLVVIERSSGIFSFLGQLIAKVGLNMEMAVVPITALATVISIVLVQGAMFSLLVMLQRLTAAIMANPLAFLLLGIVSLIVQVALFRDTLRSANNEFGMWGNIIADIYDAWMVFYNAIKPALMEIGKLIVNVVAFFKKWVLGIEEVKTKTEEQLEGINELRGSYDGFISSTISGVSNVASAFTQAWETIKNAVSSTLSYLSEVFKSWITTLMGWINSLVQKLLQALALMKALGSGGGGGGGGGHGGGRNMGGNLGPVSAMAAGGLVGGNPGIDNNLLSINGRPVARVSASERISVKPGSGRQENGTNRPERPVVVNFNINTPDVESFKRSQAQLQARAAAGMARASARNG